MIETRINLRDIAYIRPGLPATAKITAYDSSIYGNLNGVVEIVSPDTLQDEVKHDQFYYRVYVRTDRAELKIKQVNYSQYCGSANTLIEYSAVRVQCHLR